MMQQQQGTKGFSKPSKDFGVQSTGLGWLRAHEYCDSCDACKRAKPVLPKPVPMVNILIGHPWQMIATDILKVPRSLQGNQYLYRSVEILGNLVFRLRNPEICLNYEKSTEPSEIHRNL